MNKVVLSPDPSSGAYVAFYHAIWKRSILGLVWVWDQDDVLAAPVSGELYTGSPCQDNLLL